MSAREIESGIGTFYVKARPMPEPGTAGGSARAEYERRSRRSVGRAPQSTRAWAKGADGEQRVGASLETLTAGGAPVLHDRQIPGSRANIDHLVVAPSGVWVVDAKRYTGRVERRDRGRRLFVNGCDRSKLVTAMSKQVEAVERALAGQAIPIHPVLCFTGSEWPLLARPFTIGNVLVTWPTALVRTISHADDRSIAVSQIFADLLARLPSARP
jgi:hypothetical protein